MKNAYYLLACLTFFTCNLFAQPGTLDSSFGMNGKVITDFGAHDEANSVAVQQDGKIVVVGYTTAGDGDFAVVRYKANGALDNTFGQNGKIVTDFNNYDEATSLAIQTDGKIVVAGFTTKEGTDFAVVRYNINGTLDSTFGNNGKVITSLNDDSRANSVAIQPDGKIVVAGATVTGEQDFVIIRYNRNGSLDSSFGTEGKVTTNFDFESEDVARSVLIQPDGKIVAAGYTIDFSATNEEIALTRYKRNGVLDNTFGNNGRVVTTISGHDYGNAAALQPDGKIVVAVQDQDEDNSFAAARFNIDGTLDNTFSGDGTAVTYAFFDDKPFSVAIQPNGKIVFAGGLDVYSLNSGFLVVRCDSSGRNDETFGEQGAVKGRGGSTSNSVALQTDGKIVVAGSLDNNFVVIRLLGDEIASKTFTGSSFANKATGLSNMAIHLYPNPSNTELHVAGLMPEKAAIITITDMAGNIIQKEKTTGKEHIYNVSKLKAGEYAVTIFQNDKTTSLKFIKQ